METKRKRAEKSERLLYFFIVDAILASFIPEKGYQSTKSVIENCCCAASHCWFHSEFYSPLNLMLDAAGEENEQQRTQKKK